LGGAIARIEHLIDLVEIPPVTYPEIVEIASGIYADWRSRGCLIPDADILIAVDCGPGDRPTLGLGFP
jgi:predicted nucleic acid-binding protein